MTLWLLWFTFQLFFEDHSNNNLQDTLVSAPPCEDTELTDEDVTVGVSARSLESVGAVTDGAAVCGVLPCLSLMESSFLGSMEGVTPKQQTISIISPAEVMYAMHSNLQDLP